MILGRAGATLSIPYLVGRAIDQGIRPGSRVADGRVLEEYVLLLVGVVCVAAVCGFLFLRLSGHIGQSVLYDLRLRVFRHIQELSLSFYERYTSGRVIARLTSDIDALQELLATGLASLITSVISIVGVAAILVRLDLRLGMVTLLSFPVVVGLTWWFRNNSARAYRAVRRAIALVIVHYVESLNGIRAVQAFRREPRNQEIFEDVNGRYRDANTWSNRLASTFGPGVNLLGRLTTATVLIYGGYLVINRQLTIGVLAAFVLYVRQFFEPMQDLSQFYNLIQSATAALEKLSGVLEETTTVPEPAHPVALPDARGEVALEHVTFAYLEQPVLHDIDLLIPAGQLVAFARAFLADPRVLILDEATSSLDLPSERLVQRALRTLLRGRTAIIIAHRLSTVEIADRVLVMDHGRVVEDGAPADLKDSSGRYGDLHRAWLESLA